MFGRNIAVHSKFVTKLCTFFLFETVILRARTHKN